MKLKKLHIVAGFVGICLFWACVKNATPLPPVHDTLTVHKIDTLIKADTLHKTDTVLKPVDTPNMKLGLLLYLPFNGSFADSSGNNNPTTAASGAALTYDLHGYSNSAFGDNGSGHYVMVTNNGSIKFDTGYTISMDFLQRGTGLQCFLSMVNFSNGNGPSWNVGSTAPGLSNFVVGVNDVTATCNSDGTTNPNKLADTTGFIPQSESWYNAIIIYHRGTVTIYINGKLISAKTGTGTSAFLCPLSQIIVGGWWNGSEPMNGKLDEVRLYDHVLGAKEIAWLSRNFQTTSTKIRATPLTRP